MEIFFQAVVLLVQINKFLLNQNFNPILQFRVLVRYRYTTQENRLCHVRTWSYIIPIPSAYDYIFPSTSPPGGTLSRGSLKNLKPEK